MKRLLWGILCLWTITGDAQPYSIGRFPDASLKGDSYPRSFCLYHNKLVFIADSATVTQLYITDGSIAGTYAIKRLESFYNDPALTVCNDRIFFVNRDSRGAELWATDGTAAGTDMVMDINPAGDALYAGMYNPDFAVLNNKLMFAANDGIHGSEIWTTDGTARGTSLVKDMNTSAVYNSSSDPHNFVPYNGKIYFSAYDSVHGREMWYSDGTNTGTRLLKDASINGDSDPILWCAFNNRLYFRMNGASSMPNNNELWVTDGTDTGTHIFKKGNELSTYNSFPIGYSLCNGRLFFTAKSNFSAYAPYYMFSTDGTDTGTHALVPFYAAWLAFAYEDKLYFSRKDSNNISGIWISDGWVAGTRLMSNKTGLGSITMQAAFRNRLYFSGDDGTNGRELWATDGTNSGTVKIPWMGRHMSDPLPFDGSLIAFGNALFFPANYDASGIELYRYGVNTVNVASPYDPKAGLVIYPNPALNTVTVDGKEIASVIIYDANGRKVIETSKNSIDVSRLSPGGYVAAIISADGTRRWEQFVKVN